MSAGTVLITGASSGIGLELARLCAAHGFNLVLVARSEDKLRALASAIRTANCDVDILVEDLASPAAPARIMRQLEDRGIELTHLINNAGVGATGNFWAIDRERQLAILDLNIRAVVDLTHRVLPSMLARGAGRILNIGSLGGFQPGPNIATYFASKAFILSFTEALAHELRGTGVTASVHCPGPTRTPFIDAASAGNMKMYTARMATVEAVALDAFRTMQRGRVVRVHGFLNRLLLLSIRFAPRSWIRAIVSLNFTGNRRNR